MSVSGEPDTFEFADYSGILRRRWWVVLVLGGVGLLAAAGYLALAPKAYTATAQVNVTSTGNTAAQNGAVAGGRTGGAVVNLDTEAQIVRSGTVAGIAGRTLHSALAPAALLGHVSVAVPANSSVLQISCQEGSARQAAACANAFAAAYLQNRDATAAAATKAQLATVRDQLTALEKSIAKLTLQRSRLPVRSLQRASDQAQLQTASSQLHALASQSAALTASASPSGGSIISTATPPRRPSSPKKLLVLPSGLLAGLILGLIAAFTWDRLDTRVKDARDIERSGLPVLLSLSRKDMGRALLAPAGSAAGREFTELARSTAAALGDGNQLLVAGTAAGHGSSVVAANLAVALARTHDAVILVCPSRPGIAELFGLVESQWPGTHDAGQLASGAIGLDQAAQQPREFPGLRVLVLAAGLSNLPHQQARQLAAHLQASADYVLIEAPRPAPGGDSLAFAEFCDAALLAVEISRSRHPGVDDCLTRLNRLGVRVIGAAAMPQLRGTPRGLLAVASHGQQAAELPHRSQRGVTAGPGQPADALDARPGWPEPEVAVDATGSPSLSAPGPAEAADRVSGT